MVKERRVNNDQSVIDMAIQHCGNFKACYELAVLNGCSITDDLPNQKIMLIPESYKESVVQFFSAGKFVPATASNNRELCSIEGFGNGIGFWTIGFDFEIQ